MAEVRERVGGVLERVAAVDHRADRPGVQQLGEDDEGRVLVPSAAPRPAAGLRLGGSLESAMPRRSAAAE
jgi:hypothetical protein